MNYEKMWNTLKAESGYRVTYGFETRFTGEPRFLREIMEQIEQRMNMEKIQKSSNE